MRKIQNIVRALDTHGHSDARILSAFSTSWKYTFNINITKQTETNRYSEVA